MNTIANGKHFLQTVIMKIKLATIASAIAVFFQFSAHAQPDTLERVERAHRLHHSGVAGQVLLVPELMANQQVSPYQATLSVSVQRGNHTRQIEQIKTAAAGTFFLELPPGTYVIAPVLPQSSIGGFIGLSSVPVTVTVQPWQIASVEIDVIESGGIIVF